MKKRIIPVIALVLALIQLFYCPIEAISALEMVSDVPSAELKEVVPKDVESLLLDEKTKDRIKEEVIEAYKEDLEVFDSYNIVVDEENPSISGTLKPDSDMLDEYLSFDNVSTRVKKGNLKDCRLKITYTFDMDTCQYSRSTQLLSYTGIILNTVKETANAEIDSTTGFIDVSKVKINGELYESAGVVKRLDGIKQNAVLNDEILINTDIEANAEAKYADVEKKTSTSSKATPYSFVTSFDESANLFPVEKAVIHNSGSGESEIESKIIVSTETPTKGIRAAHPCIWLFVAIAELAEQIRAEKNYKYNKNLEKDEKGVAFGRYIGSQESTGKDVAAGNYRFGFVSFGDVGCEVASAYNLMIAIERPEMLSETIYTFEKLSIEFAIGFGALGSNPKQIYKYLDVRSVSYKKFTSKSDYEKYIKDTDCNIILAYSYNSLQLHTFYMLQKEGKLRSYNRCYLEKSNYHPEKSTDDILEDADAKFFVAYVVPVVKKADVSSDVDISNFIEVIIKLLKLLFGIWWFI